MTIFGVDTALHNAAESFPTLWPLNQHFLHLTCFLASVVAILVLPGRIAELANIQ